MHDTLEIASTLNIGLVTEVQFVYTTAQHSEAEETESSVKLDFKFGTRK